MFTMDAVQRFSKDGNLVLEEFVYKSPRGKSFQLSENHRIFVVCDKDNNSVEILMAGI